MSYNLPALADLEQSFIARAAYERGLAQARGRRFGRRGLLLALIGGVLFTGGTGAVIARFGVTSPLPTPERPNDFAFKPDRTVVVTGRHRLTGRWRIEATAPDDGDCLAVLLPDQIQSGPFEGCGRPGDHGIGWISGRKFTVVFGQVYGDIASVEMSDGARRLGRVSPQRSSDALVPGTYFLIVGPPGLKDPMVTLRSSDGNVLRRKAREPRPRQRAGSGTASKPSRSTSRPVEHGRPATGSRGSDRGRGSAGARGPGRIGDG